MRQISVRFLLTLTVCLLTGYAFSQKIPYVNNIQQYNVKEGDIAKIRVNVYSIKDNNGVIVPVKLADIPVEISFDSLGNRQSEKIYDIDGKLSHTNAWDYNALTGTVGQYMLDNSGNEMSKKMLERNLKDGSVNIKRYGKGDTLQIEEKWSLGATGKTINMDRYFWDVFRNIIGKKTSSTYNIEEGRSIEYLIMEYGDVPEYTWLTNFIIDWNVAKNKKTQNEKLPNGIQIKYIFDKKTQLMTEKDVIDIQGKVTEKVTYQYEFDGNGNWTKVIQSINEQPVAMAIRTFEYRVKPIKVKKK